MTAEYHGPGDAWNDFLNYAHRQHGRARSEDLNNARARGEQQPPLREMTVQGRVAVVDMGDGIFHRIEIPKERTPEFAAGWRRVLVVKRVPDGEPVVIESYWSMGA